MTARRDFIKRSLICSAGLAIAGSSSYASITHQIFDATINIKKSAMKFGLVTVSMGKGLGSLPLIISKLCKRPVLKQLNFVPNMLMGLRSALILYAKRPKLRVGSPTVR